MNQQLGREINESEYEEEEALDGSCGSLDIPADRPRIGSKLHEVRSPRRSASILGMYGYGCGGSSKSCLLWQFV